MEIKLTNLTLTLDDAQALKLAKDIIALAGTGTPVTSAFTPLAPPAVAPVVAPDVAPVSAFGLGGDTPVNTPEPVTDVPAWTPETGAVAAPAYAANPVVTVAEADETKED